MLYLFFLNKPFFWIVIWILQIIGYFGIFRKMHLNRIYAITPFSAEKKIGDTMFQTRYAFWHPFLLALIFTAAGLYMNPFGQRVSPSQKLYGLIFLFFAFSNYYGYLTRLYWRLGKSFNKNVFFRLGMILLPFVFLFFLGYRRKNRFDHGTPIRLYKLRPKKWFRWLMCACSVLLFAAEALLISLGIGYIILRKNMPGVVVQYLLNDSYNSTKDIVSDHSEVLREENMGDLYSRFSSVTPSRDYYFPDKSNVQSVVVMEYLIGADLENRVGAASTNVKQFIDATKQGSGLTFVMEAGGSYRWFTDGIKDASVGRYVIRDGKLEQVLEEDPYTCMSEPEELADFIQWTKENYPADRYMLVFWDHGAGLSYGYGIDDLNKRKKDEGVNAAGAIDVSEIADVLKNSGMKFDLIGFDACLMQDIEIASALEPYADYFLASEETEPAGGWFYTSGFAMLAKDPAVPTEEFGKEVIGSYNLYNMAYKDGKEDTSSTLSLLDLTYVKPAYEKLSELFKKLNEVILAGEDGYIDISLAANNAYTFYNQEQIDLVHYLENLKAADYDNTVLTEEEIDEMIVYAKAPVAVRNRMAAEGVNGLAVTFPYKIMSSYTEDWDQFKALGMNDEEEFFSNFFSIMAASNNTGQDDSILFQIFGAPDYTVEPWYVKGFEDYVTEAPLIDIPIRPNGDGYSLELSDKIWKIIADEKQVFYEVTGDGLKYLGMDYAGKTDEDGHPMISTDGTWISIGGQPIFYEPGEIRETENGTIFTGISKAMLNGKTEIILQIEWSPVTKDSDTQPVGRVVGYREADNELGYMLKGLSQFETGETLDFLFDYYDEEGKLIETKTSGSTYRVIAPDDITVSDEPLGQCTLKHGIILTDVYQRVFQSEMVETVID